MGSGGADAVLRAGDEPPARGEGRLAGHEDCRTAARRARPARATEGG